MLPLHVHDVFAAGALIAGDMDALLPDVREKAPEAIRPFLSSPFAEGRPLGI